MRWTSLILMSCSSLTSFDVYLQPFFSYANEWHWALQTERRERGPSLPASPWQTPVPWSRSLHRGNDAKWRECSREDKMMWKECLQCDGGEGSPAAGATVWLRFGYTHPGGNKEKLKGRDRRNYERSNMLDFGIGVMVGVEGLKVPL